MKNLLVLFTLLTLLAACKDCPPTDGEKGDLEDITYDPQTYIIPQPSHFPAIPIPASNPQTVAGVQLGRRLFYDPILSADSTQSCSSCHLPQGSFTDNLAVSKGIDGIAGRRSSMSLLNIAYVNNQPGKPGDRAFNLFWDGRAQNLEEQALLPVEDPIEMHNTWPNVLEKLRKHPTYPKLFREAFGIKDRDEMTKELAAKAIAQFERILVSSGNSKYDRFRFFAEPVFEDDEQDGLAIFENPDNIGPDAQCFHCHGSLTMSGNNFFINGIDSAGAYTDFKDLGLGAVTGKLSDNGKFRAPTLRNIALTAPYMHDGRFKTLEEVIDHYFSQGRSNPPYQDPLITQLGTRIPNSSPLKYAKLDNKHKKSLLAFLHTLTDSTFINNPDIRSPF